MVKSISYKHSSVSYIRFGAGLDVVFALHGYGQDAHAFSCFENEIGASHSLISVDLFEHGYSKWIEKEPFTTNDLLAIFKTIAQQEALDFLPFDLIGFSIGTRYAIAFAQDFPTHIKRMVLIAPPSYAFNRLMRFTVNTAVGLALFRFFVKRHQVLMQISTFLHQIRMMSRQKLFFVSRFMKEGEVLQKVYLTWYTYRKLIPHFTKFVKQMNIHAIPVILIAGKEDAITPPSDMQALVKQVQHHQVYLLHEGHKLQTQAIKDCMRTLYP